MDLATHTHTNTIWCRETGLTWDPRKGDANTYWTAGNISKADEAPVQVLGDSGHGGEFLPSPHGVASVPDCCIEVDFGGRDPRSNEICEAGNIHVLNSAPRRHLKLHVGVVAKSPIITYPWLRVSGPSSVLAAFLSPPPPSSFHVRDRDKRAAPDLQLSIHLGQVASHRTDLVMLARTYYEEKDGVHLSSGRTRLTSNAVLKNLRGKPFRKKMTRFG